MLEIARMIDKNPDKTIPFVAFTNEEPPYFGTSGIGQLSYANLCAQRDEHIMAMFSVDSIGYFLIPWEPAISNQFANFKSV